MTSSQIIFAASPYLFVLIALASVFALVPLRRGLDARIARAVADALRRRDDGIARAALQVVVDENIQRALRGRTGLRGH
jgi:hypothetical protein